MSYDPLQSIIENVNLWQSIFFSLRKLENISHILHNIRQRQNYQENKTQNKTISLLTNFESESLPPIHNQDFLCIYLQKLLLQ